MHHKEDYKNKRTRKTLGVIALFLAVLLTGCQHYNAINFVTNTQVGAKVGVNAEKIPEIQVGYNRQEAARVPVYLMTTKDGLSSSPPAINAVLSQAGKKLEAAKASPWGQSNVGAVKVAQKLIENAVGMDESSTTNKTASVLLQQIKVAAAQLSVNPAPANAATADQLEFICQLIQAEIAKPKFYAEFQEQAKFVGTRKGDDARDAYSVLGTFSGDISGSSTTGAGPEAKMKGGIAQYFATGIAAQILAEKGGAALVSTGPTAKTPSDIDPEQVKQIQEEFKRAIMDSEAVAAYVWKNIAVGNPPAPAARKTSLTKAFQGVKISGNSPQAKDAALDYYANLADAATLKSNLENSFSPNELSKMFININQ
jgi:hypothetical protein